MKFLHKHALNVHREKHIQKNTVVSTHVCKICQAIHRNKNDLKLHEKIHAGAEAVIVQECPLCGFITKDITEVDIHMKQKHDINIIRCNKCEYIAK